ncbi:fumarate hydratase [Paenibacillus thiaminolyticus]|uniref:Fumarate hydratase class I n=1 Tax=Paenibacillus thiaminolyticus TaxID=49283 RepID=A0AAP9DSU9_PANTH|nr:fumarate hydratase [Paenibacillus thiaminolyticus]MCY9533507.1 fumarate hydratase [Paenibacillus thiaminolyticus]MCY9604172.1 fumarate hydratase [Paenibacillus thiaminolyticus]MCY9606280.1 fumarate hydratase [Paenibacillus thiaminolyticus]MCY9612030.1 fumarate hydratase [Paenibacillus thiaminolyticus]MCY9618051.1 fumarate hydratase [Paenibacillus thiaminolyticus]
MKSFLQSVYDLIVETSTNLPGDVRKVIREAQAREDAATRAGLSLGTIARNIVMAETKVSPICQDTGMPTFIVHTPVGANQIVMKREIQEAVSRATKEGKLRTNSVDSLTGANSGDNLGPGTPVIHFEQWERGDIEVRLILKGGGCENKNIQYSLPAELEGLGKAGRDLDGIRKCILHAIYQAQGQGCSAGFIGVGIGGDRTTGYELAKQQLFRRVDDTNPIAELRQLEEYILDKANQLGIGTMGFGGEVTLLGCKIGVMNRLPASFFVSVAYNCWAYRRQGVLLDSASGEIKEWVYERGSELPMDSAAEGEAAGTAEEATEAAEAAPVKSESRRIVLNTPISEEQIRSLKVGDVVVINGEMHTGRDALHKYLMDYDAPVDLDGAVIYHCGPVMLKDEEGWHVKAAGPTTSIREEPYQGDIIKKFGIRAVIGKGGMGAKTLAALQEHGAVYLNAIGGAAQYYAECMKQVNGVDFLEFGIPEAMWHLDVEGFAAIVTMDAHGNSLHADVDRSSFEKLAQFKDPVFA